MTRPCRRKRTTLGRRKSERIGKKAGGKGGRETQGQTAKANPRFIRATMISSGGKIAFTSCKKGQSGKIVDVSFSKKGCHRLLSQDAQGAYDLARGEMYEEKDTGKKGARRGSGRVFQRRQGPGKINMIRYKCNGT